MPVPKIWVETDRAAIRHNLQSIRRRLGPSVAAMAVVKANAYGHGLPIVAATAVEAGAKWLGVDDVDEAAEALRVARVPTLILGYTREDRVKDAVHLGARMTVYDPRILKAASRTGKLARVHVKLETGTTRQGIGEKELVALMRLAKRLPRVVVEGLSTHYANIEDTTDHRYAAKQLAAFTRLAAVAEKAYGAPIPVKHTACSAAAILFPETYFSLARIGIAAYGLWPSDQTRVSARERRVAIDLRPALTWKTVVAQVKEVPKGTPVSYGLTARTARRSRLAVLPVGYADGYDRGLSSLGVALVRGRRVPIMGRVCMNMCVADVTDVPGVRQEDEVVLIGRQRAARVAAEELAAKLGTISYEVVARIDPTLPRIAV